MRAKIAFALFLALTSSSLLADRPDCSWIPGGCANPHGNAFAYGRTKDVPDNAYAYSGVVDDSVVDIQTAVAVPEPGSLALVGSGLAGMAVARKRKI